MRAIIFDFGGVLSEPGKIDGFCRTYALKMNRDPDEFVKLVKKVWDDAQVSKIDSKLFWEKCSDFLEVKSETFRSDLINSFVFNEDVLDLVKDLKSKYKLALLSNQIEDWLKQIIKEYWLDEVFDVIITSYDFGISKPNEILFQKLVEKLNVDPGESLYVDDLQENVSVADNLGMETILFKNINQLKEDLRRYNIN